MQCERAQEFFSDYLERTLDRPMTVALESHLGSCARCRDEVEALQETVLTLDAVPEVEPPWDGAWQVMSRIRSARAEQLEAQRRKPVPFFDWLRTLNPASAAMGAGLATLVIAGTVMVPGVSNLIRNTIFPPPPTQIASPAGADLPAVQAAYNLKSHQMDLQITPVSELPAAEVRLDMNGRTLYRASYGYGLGPSRPLLQPIIIQPTGRDAEAVWVTVSSQPKGKEYRYLIAVPLAQHPQEKVTLLLDNRPLEEALRQLVPYLDRPIVVAGQTDGNVTLNVTGMTARDCLDEVARQAGARLIAREDAYHLVPAP